jgi:uncharacterized membrane protein YoaK (UPF0700 family)
MSINGAPSKSYGFALPVSLAAIAGYVDTCTFLAFAGFFVAQATGSFVAAGSELFSANEIHAFKVLAIPVFILAGMLTAAIVRVSSPRQALMVTVCIEAILLTGLVISGLLGPLGAISGAPALFGLAAMGVQSAAVRLLLPNYGSTNVMTTNTTQFSIEIVDSLCAGRPTLKLLQTGSIMLGFLGGVVMGGVAYRGLGLAGLVLPIVVLLTLALASLVKPREQAGMI